MHQIMDDRLANLLGVAVLATHDRMRAAVEAELPAGGAAPAALVHLHAHPGETVEALRRVLGISQPATVRALDRLATAGLLERRPGPDRRSLALHLTADGERAAERLHARRTEALNALLEVLAPAERDALRPLLERLVASLAADRAGALRTCRLCDRAACTSAPGCPLQHTA
jgi:MarR family transcriptional regulator, negative regulator of the multidrug operon emrRAB